MTTKSRTLRMPKGRKTGDMVDNPFHKGQKCRLPAGTILRSTHNTPHWSTLDRPSQVILVGAIGGKIANHECWILPAIAWQLPSLVWLWAQVSDELLEANGLPRWPAIRPNSDHWSQRHPQLTAQTRDEAWH